MEHGRSNFCPLKLLVIGEVGGVGGCVVTESVCAKCAKLEREGQVYATFVELWLPPSLFSSVALPRVAVNLDMQR